MPSKLNRRGDTTVKTAGMLSLSVCLAVAGCQSTGGGSFMGGSSDDPCNIMVGTAAGAALGALLGGKDRAKGALIGAGVGLLACVAVNAVSRQTKTAEQVETDYRAQHAGKLPAGGPVVEAYNVTVNPDNEIRPGEKVHVVSDMTVVRGANKPVEDVREVLTLSGPDGTKTAEKKPAERPGSGAYENTFTLTFPKDVAPGTYPVKTQLLVNGKPASERKQNLVIVSAGEARHFALVDQ